MAVDINVSGVIAPLSAVCTQPRVTLPGGLRVQGTVPHLGASPLEVARATIGSLNAALAPLGPVFSILDAVLAIVKFAQTVPKVITRPDKVVAALVDVVKKAGALASLVPQLSVPLMVVGIIDVLIVFLGGLRTEVAAIVELEQRLASVASMSGDVPALGPIVSGVQLQVEGRRAQLACGLGDVQPLLGIVSAFAQMVGLPSIDITADPTAGAMEDVDAALEVVVNALSAVRRAIPL